MTRREKGRWEREMGERERCTYVSNRVGADLIDTVQGGQALIIAGAWSPLQIALKKSK